MIPERKDCDVFISFRGDDTRKNFVSHLYSALKRAGVNTYIDEESLQKGDDVQPSLFDAIWGSSAALVVFSKNYASSKWCLEELRQIMYCRTHKGMVVIPVFYEVDPSDIRKQTGIYGEALAIYEGKFVDEMDQDNQLRLMCWKAALTQAANISGWDTLSREYKNESQVIDKIVEDVLKKLELRFPNELKVSDLMGLYKTCEDVKLLLSKTKSKNVQVIGIWGMGGIGKTTIARALFSQLLPHYDSACFLENVRETSQIIGQSKLTSLRAKMLSELLKDEHMGSTTFIQRRLSSKKVLIVLDDVDNSEQLEVLCEASSYGAPDSKLIITTRNKHLLWGIADEDDIYEVKTLNFEDSLELFCLTAFKHSHPKEGYEGLCKRAVDYAGGVPLALKVLGSNLRNRSTEFWDSELNKVKDYPYDGIQNVLRISYDGLHILEKKIFLDIAFFHKGENVYFVEGILNDCGFFATSGLQILKDKALITISSGNKIQMHDLIQDLGLNIVRQDFQDPEKGTRLKDIEEVSDVLEYKNKGGDAVEGIKLDLSEVDDLRLNPNAFSMMSKLRFLKLYIPSGKTSGNIDYPVALNEFSGVLRYLEWHGYRLKSLPDSLCTKLLVWISMPQSHITELWHGVKNVQNLVGISLRECKHLENLPDLSKAAKLKWVNLSGCESLTELHPSILSLDTLETLTLDGCKKLRSLKSEKHLKSLKKISVKGCTSLKDFSLSSNVMENLDLNNAGIEELHSSISRSSRLRRLNLECLQLRNLPDELSFLSWLSELRISNCCFLILEKRKLCNLFDGLKCLQFLDLKNCYNVLELPDNISVLQNLRELRLDGSIVKKLPASIKYLTKLEILSLKNCKRLKSIPNLPARIKELYAINCTFLETVFTLESFAVVSIGEAKYISFENCMKLDEPSCHGIIEGALLTTAKSMIDKVGAEVHLPGSSAPAYGQSFSYEPAYPFWSRSSALHCSFTYNFLKVCLPGRSVPEQFTYRTTGLRLNIKVPSHSLVLGLSLCVVLYPLYEMRDDGAKIFCQLYDADGTKMGYPTSWSHESIRGLIGDHVYIWHDALHFDTIVRGYKQHITLEFYLTDDLGKRDVCNVRMKECGANLIFVSFPPKLPSSLLEQDSQSKSVRKLALNWGSKLKRIRDKFRK